MPAQTLPLSAHDLRMKQSDVVKKFFNKMQRQAMAIGAHDEYIMLRAAPESPKVSTPGLFSGMCGRCPDPWAV